MIVVRVELWSARTGEKTELARMEIANDGSSGGSLRNYIGRTLRGRSTAQLNSRQMQRQGAIKGWPSERVHVWNLVAAMLTQMGYGASASNRSAA